MSREIKFRAWEPDTRKMVEVFGISPLVKKVYLSHQQLFGRPGDDLLLSYMPDEEYSYVRLMQFTGLLDKNSVEIYEGDIVSFKEYDTTRIDSIEYDQEACAFYPIAGYGHTEPEWLSDFEVIGNIYENPEILEKS